MNAAAGRALRRGISWGLAKVPALDAPFRRWVFVHELRRLNDALAGTALAGRYWICGGLLLGWARDGGPLRHDVGDADFIVRAEDEPLVLEAGAALERAGFRPAFRYRNNDGRVTEYTFQRHGVRFDFFLLFDDVDEPGQRRFFAYTRRGDELLELEGRLPEPALERFEFLGRSWLKPASHEAFLSSIYGDWRTPNPGWEATSDRSLVAIRPWSSTDSAWA